MRGLGPGLVVFVCGVVAACGDESPPIEGSPSAPVDAGSGSSGSSGNGSSSSSSSGGTDGGATNAPPTATNGSLTVEIVDSAHGTLAGVDPNGDALTYAIVTPPAKGTISKLDPATGAFEYTATALAPGSDSFTFEVNDGKADSAPATMTVTLDPVLFTGHWAIANVKDNGATACTGTTFRLGHARPTTAPGYFAITERRVVCGSTTFTFNPVRMDLGAKATITDTVMTFSQSKYVSGCGTVTDDFRLEKKADGSFAFSEKAYAPCFGVGTHEITADATRTPVAYVFAEPNVAQAFGRVMQGEPAASKTIALRNVGRLPATALAVGDIAAPFGFVGGAYPGSGGTCGSQLAGLSSCTFALGMATTALGDFGDGWAASYMDGADAESETGFMSGAVLPKLPNPTAITSGDDFACAITNGSVVCWGDDSVGQTNVPALTNPKSIAAGPKHACAIDDAGVKCWGNNTSGQTTVPALSNPKSVSPGGDHTCALDDTGVVCWGGNGFKQSTVPALTTPTAVSAGTYFTCALHATGATCWGAYASTVPPLANPTKLAAGATYACAIDDTGVVCGGSPASGAGSPPPLSGPTLLDAAGSRSCAVASGTVSCWGYGAKSTPTITNATALGVGGNHVCAIANGSVVCWGSMTYP